MCHQGHTGFLVLEEDARRVLLLPRCHEDKSDVQYESTLGALHARSTISKVGIIRNARRVPLTKVSDRFDPSNATSCVGNIPLYQIAYDSKSHPPGSLQVIIHATRSDSQWLILSSGPLSTSVTCEDNWGDPESGTIWTKSWRCLLTNRIIVGIFLGMSTPCRSILLCSLLHSLTYECPAVPNGGSRSSPNH